MCKQFARSRVRSLMCAVTSARELLLVREALRRVLCVMYVSVVCLASVMLCRVAQTSVLLGVFV